MSHVVLILVVVLVYLEALIAMKRLSTMDELDSVIASQHWKKSTKLWTNFPPVRPQEGWHTC